MITNNYTQELQNMMAVKSRLYRVKNQLTQADLAMEIGVHLEVVHSIENADIISSYDTVLTTVSDLCYR